jgi:hypothetical protein
VRQQVNFPNPQTISQFIVYFPSRTLPLVENQPIPALRVEKQFSIFTKTELMRTTIKRQNDGENKREIILMIMK